MGFGNLKADGGLTALNKYLEDRSYIEGYVPSQGDIVVFEVLSGAPCGTKYVHARRWYNHILSYKSQFGSLPGVKKPIAEYGPAQANGAAEDDSDSDDLFGSDSDEDDEGALKEREERLKAYHQKKLKKPGPIAKSNIILDVKPWDDETNMTEIEEKVRSVKADGLLWGASKLVPLAYGIKKLQISCVVEDDKISTDFLEEEITAFDELVQSVDIAAFNKV